MDAITQAGNVTRRGCALLVDDRPENVEAVNRAGYVGVLVDEQTGITRPVVMQVLARLRACAESADGDAWWSTERSRS